MHSTIGDSNGCGLLLRSHRGRCLREAKPVICKTWRPYMAIYCYFYRISSFILISELSQSQTVKFIVLVKSIKLVPFARLIHHSSLISGSTIIILCLIAIRIVIGCVDLMLAFLAFIRIVCIGDLIIECIAVVFQPDSWPWPGS